MILSTLRTLTARQWASLIATAFLTAGTVFGLMALMTNLTFALRSL